MPEQKIYSDHSKGWNTSQNPFNQDPQSVAMAKNCILADKGSGFEKREGSQKLLDSDFSPEEPVQNVVTYESLSGVETTLFQVKEEWYKLDGDGTRTLVHSGSDTKQHGHTTFQGKFIFGSEDENPEKFLYLQPPLEPETGQTSSGSLQSRTYWVAVTYTSANGETNRSVIKRQDVDSNKVLTVTSPASQDGSSKWKVYVSKDRDDLKFQKELDVGTDYQEPDGGIGSGSNPPTTNDAWATISVGGNAPNANIWHTHNSRVFAAGEKANRMRLKYSELDNEDKWPGPNTSTGGSAEPGFIEFEKILDYGDEITALESFQDRLLVFFRDSFVSLSFPEDATQFSVEQVMRGKGAVNDRTVINVGNDVLFLSSSGIESVSQNFGVENLTFGDDNPSSAIDTTIREDVKQMFDDGTLKWADTSYYFPENIVCFLIPQSGSESDVQSTRLYIFDLSVGAWSYFDDIKPRCMDVDKSGKWYTGLLANVGELYDGTYDDQGNDIEMIVATVWQFLGDPSTVKVGKFIELPAIAGSDTQFQVRFTWDFAIDGYQDPAAAIDEGVNAAGVDDWGESLWDTAPFNSPERGKPRIPIRGRGKSVKTSFIEKSQTFFELPWWKYEFKKGGLRTARG